MLADYVVHESEVHEQVVDVIAHPAAVLTLATQQATVFGHERSGRFILSDTGLRDDAGFCGLAASLDACLSRPGAPA